MRQAIRYTLSDSDEAFDAVLKTTLIDTLSVILRDKELENRRLALTTLNSAAHNKPDLIIPNLGTFHSPLFVLCIFRNGVPKIDKVWQ